MSAPFNERFGLPISDEEARTRFINRVETGITNTVIDRYIVSRREAIWSIENWVALSLGLRFEHRGGISHFLEGDFYRCLQVVEACADWARNNDHAFLALIDKAIVAFISRAEAPLGIEWDNGKFFHAGAKELDEPVLHYIIKWAAQKGYESVRVPLVQAWHALHEARREPSKSRQAVILAYEALEALSKLILDKPRELSRAREQFLSKVGAPEELRPLVKAYIEYACNYRHGKFAATPHRDIPIVEAETFVYMTGSIIRLVMNTERVSGAETLDE